MILRLFQGNQPLGLLFLPLIISLLWVPSFWAPPSYSADAMPANAMLSSFATNFPLLSALLALLLVLLQALLFNYLVNESNFLARRSNLPGFAYALVCSLFHQQHTLTPALLSALFLLLACYRIFAMGRSERGAADPFDAGLLIGIGGLIYLPLLWFVPLILIALNSFRSFKWREWALGIIGAGLPFLFTWFVYFWQNDTGTFANALSSIWPNLVQGHFESGSMFYTTIGVLAIMVLMGVPYYLAALNQNVVSVRKGLVLLLWMFVLGTLAAVFSSMWSMHLLVLLAIPSATLMAQLMQQLKRTWITDALLLLLFAASILQSTGVLAA